jgi:hypothetical protein
MAQNGSWGSSANAVRGMYILSLTIAGTFQDVWRQRMHRSSLLHPD